MHAIIPLLHRLRASLLLTALTLAAAGVGCRTQDQVRSGFANDEAPLVIAGQAYRLRVQADTDELRTVIEEHAADMLRPTVSFAPLEDGQAGWIDLTFLNSEHIGRQWKPRGAASFGISSGGGSYSGLALGVESAKPEYPTMVMAVKVRNHDRLWYGTTWLKPERGETPTDVARNAVDLLVNAFVRDLQKAHDRRTD